MRYESVWITPERAQELLKDGNFINASEYGSSEVVTTGEVGRIVDTNEQITWVFRVRPKDGFCVNHDKLTYGKYCDVCIKNAKLEVIEKILKEQEYTIRARSMTGVDMVDVYYINKIKREIQNEKSD